MSRSLADLLAVANKAAAKQEKDRVEAKKTDAQKEKERLEKEKKEKEEADASFAGVVVLDRKAGGEAGEEIGKELGKPPPPDLWLRLGVDRDTPKDEVNEAFRKLAAVLHPDKHNGNPKARRLFQLISEARAVLSNEKQRADYIDSCTEYLRVRVPCKQFMNLGRCALGAKCGFWHDPNVAGRLRDMGHDPEPDKTEEQKKEEALGKLRTAVLAKATEAKSQRDEALRMAAQGGGDAVKAAEQARWAQMRKAQDEAVAVAAQRGVKAAWGQAAVYTAAADAEVSDAGAPPAPPAGGAAAPPAAPQAGRGRGTPAAPQSGGGAIVTGGGDGVVGVVRKGQTVDVWETARMGGPHGVRGRIATETSAGWVVMENPGDGFRYFVIVADLPDEEDVEAANAAKIAAAKMASRTEKQRALQEITDRLKRYQEAGDSRGVSMALRQLKEARCRGTMTVTAEMAAEAGGLDEPPKAGAPMITWTVSEVCARMRSVMAARGFSAVAAANIVNMFRGEGAESNLAKGGVDGKKLLRLTQDKMDQIVTDRLLGKDAALGDVIRKKVWLVAKLLQDGPKDATGTEWQKEWECPKCGWKNRMDNQFCGGGSLRGCKAPRALAAEKADKPVRAAWQCVHCNHFNPPHNMVCGGRSSKHGCKKPRVSQIAWSGDKRQNDGSAPAAKR